MIRRIVRIDEEKCNGCGLCVTACAEGAIQIVGGKARLVSETYCDGLGACLGECPQDAITIEEREASFFSEEAVKTHLAAMKSKVPPRREEHSHQHSGCPGMKIMSFAKKDRNEAAQSASAPAESELSQWPLQLHLVMPSAPYWDNSDLLISADCVPFAYAGFHQDMLKGKKLIIACPKLDDTEPYLEKLTAMFSGNNIKSITVARMEVPCCGGLVAIARKALEDSGRNIPFSTVIVGVDGRITEKN